MRSESAGGRVKRFRLCRRAPGGRLWRVCEKIWRDGYDGEIHCGWSVGEREMMESVSTRWYSATVLVRRK